MDTLPRSLFLKGTAQTAERLLALGKVAAFTFFRKGIAADVIAPNGRRESPFLVLGDGSGPLPARCSCAPKQQPGNLCPHLGALLLAARRDPRFGGRLPGEAFEASVVHLVGKGLHEAGLTAPPPPRLATDAERAKRLQLQRMATTEQEADFNAHGVRTQRQVFEESPHCAWAESAFLLWGDPRERLGAEVSEGRIVLALRDDAGGTVLRVTPAPASIPRLLPLLSASGLSVEREALVRSFRVALEPDGSLLLTPVYLSRVPGAEGVLEKAAVAAARCGELVLLPGSTVLASVAETGPLFPEPEAPAQGTLAFDDDYVPSPFGPSHERVTRVGPDEALRFLSRHARTLASLPKELLPEALQGGGPAELTGDARVHLEGREGESFVVGLEYLFPAGPLPFHRVLVARRKGTPFLEHGPHLVAVQDPSFGFLDSVPREALRGKGKAARLVLSPLAYHRLRAYLHGTVTVEAAPGVSTDALDELAMRSARLPAPAPSTLGMSLFDFQTTGYAWLWFLWRSGLGGLLCDDMGLGKTHQAMALMRAVQLERHGAPPRVLVVGPASLLPHWEEKLRRYLPGMPVVVHHGYAREDTLPEAGVVVTSYGVVRSTPSLFAASDWDLLVADEVQTVKNATTLTHQALVNVKARVALGLTGTPVENSVQDVRSLFAVVLPGLLPGEAEFRRAFTQPIEERRDPRARDRLQRMTHPFVLRRTKEQVLPDLPEKILDTRHCDLTDEQAALYKAVVDDRGASLVAELDGGGPVPYVHVFAVLTRLKQICNHPASLTSGSGDYRDGTSGKWSLFCELLDEALGSGLKVVVFSQYVRMLGLIEAYLRDLGVGFATIKGETQDRATPLARFREDPSCRVFSGSLRASGLGIDLTAASVVVHYDLWWNQAREDQATDRVHRIGQTRGVQVLRLVTRGTLEERIDALVARKAELAGSVVPEDDPRLAKQFTREELKALLGAGPSV